MTPTERFRRGVLAVVALGAAGTAAELVLAEHHREAVQWLPTGVCVLLVGGALAGIRPQARTPLVGTAIAALSAAVAVFGVWEHFEHNLAFELELAPDDPIVVHVIEAMYGAGPLLAPGALALLGALLWLGTRPR